jgi:hypothetical protein
MLHICQKFWDSRLCGRDSTTWVTFNIKSRVMLSLKHWETGLLKSPCWDIFHRVHRTLLLFSIPTFKEISKAVSVSIQGALSYFVNNPWRCKIAPVFKHKVSIAHRRHGGISSCVLLIHVSWRWIVMITLQLLWTKKKWPQKSWLESLRTSLEGMEEKQNMHTHKLNCPVSWLDFMSFSIQHFVCFFLS